MTTVDRLPLSLSQTWQAKPTHSEAVVFILQLPVTQQLLQFCNTTQWMICTVYPPKPIRVPQKCCHLGTIQELLTPSQQRIITKDILTLHLCFLLFFFLLQRPSERPAPTTQPSHGVYIAKTQEKLRARRWHKSLRSPCEDRSSTNHLDRKFTNCIKVSNSTF